MAENSNRDKEKKYKSVKEVADNKSESVRGGETKSAKVKDKAGDSKEPKGNPSDVQDGVLKKSAHASTKQGEEDSLKEKEVDTDRGESNKKETSKTEAKKTDNESKKSNKTAKEAESNKTKKGDKKPEWDELVKPQPAIQVNWYDQNPDAKAASDQAVKEFENRREERKNASKKPKSKKPQSLWAQMLATVGIDKKRKRKAKKKPARPVEPSYRLEYNNRLKSSIAARAMQIQTPKPNRRGIWFILFLVLLLALILVGVGTMLRQGANDSKKSSSTNGNNQKTEEKVADFDISYNKTIGFVGDSLTYGYESPNTRVESPAPTDEVKSLGGEYRAINRGVNGSTTQDWQNKLLVPALKEFKDNNVEVVQIMLGTNDSAHLDLSIDDIMGYYRDIIRRLKDNGAKVIIINKVPYSPQHDDGRINRINLALNELVDGDKVFMGDDKSYEYFRNHLELFVDGTHFTADGYAELAKLWTGGFKRVLTGLDKNDSIKSTLTSNKYKLNSNDEFNYAIGRSSEWLTIGDDSYGGIYIDDERLNSDQYMITGGKNTTKISFSNTKLDSLSTGKHRAEVRYSDGIKFSDEFEITD